MLFNVLVVVSLEILAVCCVCMGFIFGRYTLKKECKPAIEKIVLDDHVLDPVSPEDQLLMRKLEEEAKGYDKREED